MVFLFKDKHLCSISQQNLYIPNSTNVGCRFQSWDRKVTSYYFNQYSIAQQMMFIKKSKLINSIDMSRYFINTFGFYLFLVQPPQGKMNLFHHLKNNQNLYSH